VQPVIIVNEINVRPNTVTNADNASNFWKLKLTEEHSIKYCYCNKLILHQLIIAAFGHIINNLNHIWYTACTLQ